MTIDRARELLGLEAMTDVEVEKLIAQSSQFTREILRIALTENDRIDLKGEAN